MTDTEEKKAVEALPTDLLRDPPDVVPEKKKKKMGRPKGSKNTGRAKKPKGMELTKVSETKDKKLTKRDLLFAKEIERLGFDTSFQLIQHYELLVKSLRAQVDKKTGILPLGKEVAERVWQVSDMLKSIASLQFAKLKAVELAPNTSDRVTLNFNLNNASTPQIDNTSEESKPLKMFQQEDGSFSLPT